MSNLKEIFTSYFSYLAPKNLIWTDVVEIILIAMVIYSLFKWIKDTRAWSLVKGFVVLAIIWIVAEVFQFNAILWIFANAVNVGILALIIIFQPELRRALEQLGRRNISLFSFDMKDENKRFSDNSVTQITEATFAMAAVKTGALIAIECETSLGEYENTGIRVDAAISSGLLINIFEHNTPLHDGAVIIKNDRINAATCILPVSDNMQLSKELGTRHRAGVGLSEVTDAFVIIVSEETGKVSIARNGQLVRGVDEMYLRNKLRDVQRGTTINVGKAIKNTNARNKDRKVKRELQRENKKKSIR